MLNGSVTFSKAKCHIGEKKKKKKKSGSSIGRLKESKLKKTQNRQALPAQVLSRSPLVFCWSSVIVFVASERYLIKSVLTLRAPSGNTAAPLIHQLTHTPMGTTAIEQWCPPHWTLFRVKCLASNDRLGRNRI